MHLVDDVNLVARLARRKLGILDDLGAHVVDARLRRGVHLDYVHARAVTDAPAKVADSAGLRRWTVQAAVRAEAVERASQQPGRGGLTAAARATEEVGVRDTPHADGVLEYGGDVLLADHLAKRLRAVFAIERDVGHVAG